MKETALAAGHSREKQRKERVSERKKEERERKGGIKERTRMGVRELGDQEIKTWD